MFYNPENLPTVEELIKGWAATEGKLFVYIRQPYHFDRRPPTNKDFYVNDHKVTRVTFDELHKIGALEEVESPDYNTRVFKVNLKAFDKEN